MLLRRSIIVVIASLASLSASGALAEEPIPAKLWTEKPVAKPLDADAPVSMRAFSRLAKELSPAVVNVNVERRGVPIPFMPNGGPGLGTGFIIHSKGYVLTNNHVVDEADTIVVKLANEHEYPAKVVGSYEPLDIALLKIDVKEPLVAVPLGSSEAIDIGEWVIAIGNPFGLSHTVTAGIVSAKGRRGVTPGAEAKHARFIQTDASINPGNSGGPLINIRGEVVGINTAIRPDGQGIGFAVPIDMVKTVLPQLATGKVNRSYLGVLVGPVSKDMAAKLGIESGRGALVTEVKPETPAARAGLEAGDIITSFDGHPIDHWEDLPWLASMAGSTRALKLRVQRGGAQKELPVTLISYPEEDKQATRDAKDLGLVVAKLPKESGVKMGLEAGQGVLVKEVKADGLADQLDIEVGDVVTQVNYEAVKGGPEGYEQLVASVPRGQLLALTVRRGDKFMFKVFPPG